MRDGAKEIAALLLFGLSGCVVAAIQPFYEKTDLVQDDRILGRWSCVGDELTYMTILNMDDGKYQIRSSEGKAIDKEDPAQDLALFRIGGLLLADLMYGVGEGRNPGIPGHVIYKVEVSDTEIMMTGLDHEALKKALSTKRIKVPYLIQEGTEYVILTGSTKDLKQFLLKQSMEKGLWEKTPSLHLRRATD